MKRVLLFLLIAFSLAAQAQVYNNEWIDYNKTYYKFKVGTTGAFRISQAALSSIGLGSTPAEQFQLCVMGRKSQFLQLLLLVRWAEVIILSSGEK